MAAPARQIPTPDLAQRATEATINRAEYGLLVPRTRQRYKQAQALLAQGVSIRGIMRTLDLARGTVQPGRPPTWLDGILHEDEQAA